MENKNVDKTMAAKLSTEKVWIPQVIAIVMLLWALYPKNPYGYYILLRWVCCGVFSYLAFQAYLKENYSWIWVLGITAAVYNPIIRVHLNREMWTVINLITIGIALASVFILKRKNQEDKIIPTP